MVKKLQDWLQQQGFFTPLNGQAAEECIYCEGVSGAVQEFQTRNGLRVDGNFGPATRILAKRDGFDFEAVALQTPGETIFMLPNGNGVRWSPEPPSA